MWRTYLKTLERVRSWVVATGDEAKAKELVCMALMFARFMVNTSVATSETWFAHWHKTGHYPSFHRKQGMAIRRFVKKTDCLTLLQTDDWKLWRLFMGIEGLGPAKAAMAVGLMGGKLACIDRHVLAYFMVSDTKGIEGHYKSLTNPKTYREHHWRFFGMQDNPRDAQWSLFERQVPAFADSAHWPYFEAVFSLV